MIPGKLNAKSAANTHFTICQNRAPNRVCALTPANSGSRKKKYPLNRWSLELFEQMSDLKSAERRSGTAHKEVMQPPSAVSNIGKILLVSAVPPSTNYTGALMLESMCRALPPDKLSCFAVLTEKMDSAIHPDWQHIPYQHRQKPPESHRRHFPMHLGLLESFIVEQNIAIREIPRLADEIVSFAKSNGVERIWCTLEGQTLIRLAHCLQKRLPLPMVAQVWDPPTWWLRDNNVDPISRSGVLKTFARVLSHPNTTIAAASWAMAEQYSKDYGSKAIPVVPGLPEDWALEPSSGLNDSTTLTIGFAGQLYASDNWNCLMHSLDSIGWSLDGRKVEVIALGRFFETTAKTERNIRFRGWRPQRETLQILSECDFLYCPYWFSSRHEIEARLSFPSKLTTYLASGRPVLFHGPKYASPSRFLEARDAAIQCNSLAPEELLETIRFLVSNQSSYTRLVKNGLNAFYSCLTEKHTQTQFLKTLAD